MKTLTLSFRIFLKDDFLEKVKEYAERDSIDDVTEEDIVWYVRDNIEPAYNIAASSGSFEVEGGDTDGWFVTGIQGYD